MLKKLSLGTLYPVTAFMTGYMVLYLMLETIYGGPWSWWYPIMLGASILLLAGGVHVIAPRVKNRWLSAVAGVLPLIMCGAFGALPLRCWIFAIAIAFASWAGLALASAIKRTATTGLMAALILAASWAPPSVRSLTVYFSPNLQTQTQRCCFG